MSKESGNVIKDGQLSTPRTPKPTRESSQAQWQKFASSVQRSLYPLDCSNQCGSYCFNPYCNRCAMCYSSCHDNNTRDKSTTHVQNQLDPFYLPHAGRGRGLCIFWNAQITVVIAIRSVMPPLCGCYNTTRRHGHCEWYLMNACTKPTWPFLSTSCRPWQMSLYLLDCSNRCRYCYSISNAAVMRVLQYHKATWTLWVIPREHMYKTNSTLFIHFLSVIPGAPFALEWFVSVVLLLFDG